MSPLEWSVISGMVVLIMGCLVYAWIRLLDDARRDLDPKSQRLARALGYPRLLDPLFARPMSAREKFGWITVAVVIVVAVAAT